MSRIAYVEGSHRSFDDEFIKELVYLCFDGRFRVAYVRKSSKTGGLFWSPVTIGISVNGQREYFDSFIQDSNFLERDIKDFLEKRKWENNSNTMLEPPSYPHGLCANLFPLE